MNTVKRTLLTAKSSAAMAWLVGRATGRADMGALYAARYLTQRDQPVDLNWHGFKLAARWQDWSALQEVLFENEYGALVPYLQGKPRPTVLDLGANIGTFALFAFSVAPNAKVMSFEPSAATFALLSRTVAANPHCRWTAHRIAAWSEDGSVSFSNRASSTASRISSSGDETVPAQSLATILRQCDGEIDVAKIDIEGAEEALLVTAGPLLEKISTLVVELHPDRCDAARVSATLRASYGQLYRIPGRRSTKPLLLATRHQSPKALPLYLD